MFTEAHSIVETVLITTQFNYHFYSPDSVVWCRIYYCYVLFLIVFVLLLVLLCFLMFEEVKREGKRAFLDSSRECLYNTHENGHDTTH